MFPSPLAAPPTTLTSRAARVPTADRLPASASASSSLLPRPRLPRPVASAISGTPTTTRRGPRLDARLIFPSPLAAPPTTLSSHAARVPTADRLPASASAGSRLLPRPRLPRPMDSAISGTPTTTRPGPRLDARLMFPSPLAAPPTTLSSRAARLPTADRFPASASAGSRAPPRPRLLTLGTPALITTLTTPNPGQKAFALTLSLSPLAAPPTARSRRAAAEPTEDRPRRLACAPLTRAIRASAGRYPSL